MVTAMAAAGTLLDALACLLVAAYGRRRGHGIWVTLTATAVIFNSTWLVASYYGFPAAGGQALRAIVALMQGLSPSLLLHFIAAYTGQPLRAVWGLWAATAAWILLGGAAVLTSPLELHQYAWGTLPHGSWQMLAPFPLYLYALVTGWVALRRYQGAQAAGDERARVNLLLAVAVMKGLAPGTVVPLFYGVGYPWLLPLAIFWAICFGGLLLLAAWRHNFLDVYIAVRRAAVYTAAVLVLLAGIGLLELPLPLAVLLLAPLVYFLLSSFERSVAATKHARDYSQRLTEAVEQERLRWARELHDETAQNLAVLLRRVEWLQVAVEGGAPVRGEIPVRLQEVREVLSGTLQGVRRIASDLRPAILDDLGLGPALEWLASHQAAQHGMHVTTEIDELQHRPPATVELTVYRVAQEALHNARRHGGAKQVRLQLSQDARGLVLAVVDDGSGFRVPDSPGGLVARGHFGLAGMHERLALVGGRLLIHSTPGKGTSVTAIVPGEPWQVAV